MKKNGIRLTKQICRALIAADLTATQFRIVLVYLQYPCYHFTYRELAAMTGTSKSVIGRALPYLVQIGILHTVGYGERDRRLIELQPDVSRWSVW